jgi:hypothetical protein
VLLVVPPTPPTRTPRPMLQYCSSIVFIFSNK